VNKNATIVNFNIGSSSIKFSLYIITNENLSYMVQVGENATAIGQKICQQAH